MALSSETSQQFDPKLVTICNHLRTFMLEMAVEQIMSRRLVHAVPAARANKNPSVLECDQAREGTELTVTFFSTCPGFEAFVHEGPGHSG